MEIMVRQKRDKTWPVIIFLIIKLHIYILHFVIQKQSPVRALFYKNNYLFLKSVTLFYYTVFRIIFILQNDNPNKQDQLYTKQYFAPT